MKILSYIIIFVAAYWSISLAHRVKENTGSWAWGAMALFGCCVVTPLIVWLIMKITDLD